MPSLPAPEYEALARYIAQDPHYQTLLAIEREAREAREARERVLVGEWAAQCGRSS